MPPKKRKPKGPIMAPLIPKNTKLIFRKTSYLIGTKLGSGGFGAIYNCTNSDNKSKKYACKIEPQDNGPLFCEQAFYLNLAQEKQINQYLGKFVKSNKFINKNAVFKKNLAIDYCPIPEYVAHGLLDDEAKFKMKLRYMVMPLYLGGDLQKVIDAQPNKILPHPVQNKITIQILHALNFMQNNQQDKTYVHADIKGLNILLDSNPVKNEKTFRSYLVDFGLTYRVPTDLSKVVYKPEPKAAGDGTTEYASRDLHVGAKPSFRGDLEILFYCCVHWATGYLPWIKILEGPKDKVYELKDKALKTKTSLSKFLKDCFGQASANNRTVYPELVKFGEYVIGLDYNEKPDFDKLFGIFGAITDFQSDQKKKNSSDKRPRRKRNPSPSDCEEEEEDDAESEPETESKPKSKKAKAPPKKVATKPTSSKTKTPGRATRNSNRAKIPVIESSTLESTEEESKSTTEEKICKTLETQKLAPQHKRSNIELSTETAESDSENKENHPEAESQEKRLKISGTPKKKLMVRSIKNPVTISCQTTPGLKKMPLIGELQEDYNRRKMAKSRKKQELLRKTNN